MELSQSTADIVEQSIINPKKRGGSATESSKAKALKENAETRGKMGPPSSRSRSNSRQRSVNTSNGIGEWRYRAASPQVTEMGTLLSVEELSSVEGIELVDSFLNYTHMKNEQTPDVHLDVVQRFISQIHINGNDNGYSFKLNSLDDYSKLCKTHNETLNKIIATMVNDSDEPIRKIFGKTKIVLNKIAKVAEMLKLGKDVVVPVTITGTTWSSSIVEDGSIEMLDDTDEGPQLLNLDNVILETENDGNIKHHLYEKSQRETRGKLFAIRLRLLERLRREYKGTRTTCIILSRDIEDQTSASMADNAWASMIAHGIENSEFKVGETNSPYMALVTFKNEPTLLAAMNTGDIVHQRLNRTGELYARGRLYFMDLRVNKEEFVVTGSDWESWEVNKNEIVAAWQRTYNDITVRARKGVKTMKITRDGKTEEIRRDTPDILLTIESKPGQVHSFFTGQFSLNVGTAEGQVKREFEIRSSGLNQVCRECGGDDRCKRLVPGSPKTDWACKTLCWYCKAPAGSHDEEECGKKGWKTNQKEFRLNAALRQGINIAEKKVFHFSETQGIVPEEGVQIKAKKDEVVKKYKKQYNTLVKDATKAAENKESAFLHKRDIQNAKLRQLRNSDIIKQKNQLTEEKNGGYRKIRITRQLDMKDGSKKSIESDLFQAPADRIRLPWADVVKGYTLY